jgi:hypothetical protein
MFKDFGKIRTVSNEISITDVPNSRETVNAASRVPYIFAVCINVEIEFGYD